MYLVSFYALRISSLFLSKTTCTRRLETTCMKHKNTHKDQSHVRKNVVKLAVEKIKSKLHDQVDLPFRDILSDSEIRAIMQEEGLVNRTRIFPPETTLRAFLEQMLNPDHSCAAAVARINADRIANNQEPGSPNTGDYVKARIAIPELIIDRINDNVNIKLEKNPCPQGMWREQEIKIFDGSTILMPDTAENQKEFPQHSNQTEGAGFPIARIVALTTLSTAAILGVEMGKYKGKGTGEMALARNLLEHLVDGDIVLGDRYYATYFFMATLMEMKTDFVFGQHGARKSDFRTGTRLEKGDHVIKLERPSRPSWMSKEDYEQVPKTITIREIKISADKPGFRAEPVIITTSMLNSKVVSKFELAELYNRRWNIELDLRNVKTTMNLDMLTCKTPAMIRKEIKIAILSYNLIRLMIVQAAFIDDIDPRTISFKGAMQMIVANLHNVSEAMVNTDRYVSVLCLIVKMRVGNRPGRYEPRAVKRRPKPHPRLKGPRKKYHQGDLKLKNS